MHDACADILGLTSALMAHTAPGTAAPDSIDAQVSVQGVPPLAECVQLMQPMQDSRQAHAASWELPSPSSVAQGAVADLYSSEGQAAHLPSLGAGGGLFGSTGQAANFTSLSAGGTLFGSQHQATDLNSPGAREAKQEGGRGGRGVRGGRGRGRATGGRGAAHKPPNEVVVDKEQRGLTPDWIHWTVCHHVSTSYIG